MPREPDPHRVVTPRIAVGLLVNALVRVAEGAGGGAMVLAKGDATSGAILLVLAERGQVTSLCERTLGLDDIYVFASAGPAPCDDPATVADYIAKRRRTDPDLWVVEVDHPDALGLARRMIG